MKILELLNKIFLPILISLLLVTGNSYSEDQPVDIWNIDKSKINKDKNENLTQNDENQNKSLIETSNLDILKIDTQETVTEIKLDQDLNYKKIKILGLYDPEEYGLNINMWSNSDGDQLKNIFAKLNNMSLSKDARKLMNISILTNANHPKKKYNRKRVYQN